MSEKTFRIPADIAAHCIKAGFALASSEKMLRREYEMMEDPHDPEWQCSIPHQSVATCANNLKQAAEFLHWLGQFAEEGDREGSE